MLYNSVYSPLKVRGFSSFALAKLESRSSRSDPGLLEQLDFDFSCIQGPPRRDGGHAYSLTRTGEGTHAELPCPTPKP
eukprot:1671331-Rhodomonas_salina.1